MLIDYLTMVLGEGTVHHTSKGVQYSYHCPFCDDHKERLFVNISRQVYICHNCEKAGSTISFIMDYSGCDYITALKIFRDHEGYAKPLPNNLEQEVYSRLITSTSGTSSYRYVHPLPEEFILMEDAKGKKGRQAYEYLKSRGITLDMCRRYYIGYCEEGKYKDRIIMPDFEDGELVYWQARTWLPQPKDPVARKFYRKVLNPSLTKEQIEEGIVDVGKSEVISNIDLIRDIGVAVLVEGKMDSFTVGDTGACIHGKVLSDTQFIKLVSNKDKIHTVAVCMDGDAFSSTLTIAKRLYQHFDNVLVCRLNPKDDPNSLGRKGMLEVLKNAEPYSPMFECKCRVRGWT